MLITSNKPLVHEPTFVNSKDSKGYLSSIAYRSRVSGAQTPEGFRKLIGDAQERNRAHSITGQLICEDNRYYQWIEGPGEHLQYLWEAIKRDPRHCDIEVLGNQQIPARFFAEWDLKVSTKFEAPPTVTKQTTQSTLPDLIKDLVIPQLAAKHANKPKKILSPKPHRQVKELAANLVSVDPNSALELFAQLHADTPQLEMFYGSVVEPTARVLGDMWHSDHCSEFQLTVALVRLQSAVRSIGPLSPWQAAPNAGLKAVLVAPQPGELHMLGAVLDEDVLYRAGWQSQLELPESDEAVQKLVADNWFDALDLNLSVSVCRDQWLDRLTETIAKARLASCNPELVVVVGGRVFYDDPSLGKAAGANGSLSTTMDVGSLIMRELIASTKNDERRLH
jgi:hypothetical protein